MGNTTNSQSPVSFGAILKKMHTETRTGQLIVESPDFTVKIHLREGKIVNVDTPTGGEWVIGEYLVATGSISERRMLRCLKQGTQKNLPPEQIAIEKRYVTKDVVQKFVELCAREAILPLFTRVGIMVRFQNVLPKANPLQPPLSIPYLIKEGARRSSDWPVLMKRIPSFDVVYDKDKSFVNSLATDSSQLGDNPIFTDNIDQSVGANERIVYFFVDGKRNVRQLARISGLDLYTTSKSLYNLESKSMVKVVGEVSRKDLNDSTVFPYLFRFAMYLVLAALVAALVIYRPGPVKLLTGEQSLRIERIHEISEYLWLESLLDGVEESWLLHGTLPTDLQSLPALQDNDVPEASRFRYQPLTGSRFILQAPSEEADNNG